MNIEIIIIDERLREFGPPVYQSKGAAAVDLRSCEDRDITLRKGEGYKFHCGFEMFINQPGVAAFVLPKSGLGSKGLALANTIGLIDSDYQGELIMNARWNPLKDDDVITIQPGERIFQMVFMPVILANFLEVEFFSEKTERGSGGFGSTGRI